MLTGAFVGATIGAFITAFTHPIVQIVIVAALSLSLVIDWDKLSKNKKRRDMRIIKEGKLPPEEKKTVCPKCGCVFMYDRSDIHSDCREGCWVVCPTCGEYIDIDKSGIL